jgi:hypothetical protein
MMLSLSDTDIQEISSIILNQGYDVAFLVPTETGLIKSIIDAHQSLRAYFKRTEFHDYEQQIKGVKHQITAYFVTEDFTYEKTVSLYRPETKNGDPTIWIYGLKDLAIAGNLLALIVIDSQLYIINCSRFKDLEKALQDVLPKVNIGISETATELLQKLIVISNKGFISTVTHGDTGVGMTLESELGISANSSKNPDYKGIELKCSRVDKNRRQTTKSQLFSKVPNWKLSPFGSAKILISTRGYTDVNGRNALYHTMDGLKPNSLGLYLDIDYANSYLRQMFIDLKGNDFNPEHDTTWLLSDLKSALLKKHSETFWVKAKHNANRVAEEFHYIEVEYTANPYIDMFETLIETGLITMDYTMHINPEGDVRDHGYLFKLRPNSKTALFPEAQKFDLTKL